MTAEQDKLRSMRKTLEFSVTPWNGFRRAMAVVVRPFARPGMRHKEKVLLFSPLLVRFYSKYAIAVFVDLVSIVEREDSREITYFGTKTTWRYSIERQRTRLTTGMRRRLRKRRSNSPNVQRVSLVILYHHKHANFHH